MTSSAIFQGRTFFWGQGTSYLRRGFLTKIYFLTFCVFGAVDWGKHCEDTRVSDGSARHTCLGHAAEMGHHPSITR